MARIASRRATADETMLLLMSSGTKEPAAFIILAFVGGMSFSTLPRVPHLTCDKLSGYRLLFIQDGKLLQHAT